MFFVVSWPCWAAPLWEWEARLHQLAVSVSFEDLFSWRWFPGIGRCNPSEEWGLGEHPGGKRLRSDCGEVWQLQIFLDRVLVVWWRNRTRTDLREELLEGRLDIKTEEVIWSSQTHFSTRTGNKTEKTTCFISKLSVRFLIGDGINQWSEYFYLFNLIFFLIPEDSKSTWYNS